MFCEKSVSTFRDWHILRDNCIIFPSTACFAGCFGENRQSHFLVFLLKTHLYIQCQKTIFVYEKKQFFSKFFDFLGFAIAYFQKFVYNDVTFLDKRNGGVNSLKETKKRGVLSPADAERLKDLIWTHRNVIQKILFDILHPEFSYMIEDCESEVMMIAVEHAHELLSHTAPTGWFIVTTRNVAHAACRKEIKRIQNDTSAEGVDLTIAEDPLENILYEEWVKNGVVDQLLSRLTPREREVYALSFAEGKTTKEIAERLQIGESTVRNIRKNIMDKIKRDVMEHRFETF